MESQPQNPEFRINPENFHPCVCLFGPALRIGYLSIYAQMHPNTPMLTHPAGHEV